MKTKDIQALHESKLAQMNENKMRLVEQWGDFIKGVEDYNKANGRRSLNDHDRMNIAQCLDNALSESAGKKSMKLFEDTTYQSDISFLGVQLPVISALVPSLVLNEIASVQALDRRQGAVFYMDAVYDQAKGSIAADATMMSSKTGHNTTRAGRLYGSTRVWLESIGTGDGSDVTWSGTLTYKPVVAEVNSIQLSWVSGSTTYTAVDSTTAGTLVGTGLASGAITASAGTYAIVFESAYAPDNGTNITLSYKYNYETASNEIPGVNISITSEVITAEDFPLRADYTLGASIDLQKAHGISLEDKIIEYLGGEIKFEMDHLGIDIMYEAAIGATGAGVAPAFNATPGTDEAWIWRKFMFLDNVEAASNLVFAKTLRAFANFIVCGNNVARLIKQLKPNFEQVGNLASITPTGPIVIGKLDGRLVIQDPFMSTNTYMFGYKGSDYFKSGMIFAPYIPLMTTPTLLMANLKAQKGFLSSAGFKVVNPGMYGYGVVTGMQA